MHRQTIRDPLLFPSDRLRVFSLPDGIANDLLDRAPYFEPRDSSGVEVAVFFVVEKQAVGAVENDDSFIDGINRGT